MSVQLLFGPHVDVTAWSQRHERGDVPDALPYGLDRLAELGLPVVLTRPSSTPRLLRGALRRVGSGIDWAGRPQQTPGAQALLSWDERAGLPAALVMACPVVTGVIWATDARRLSPYTPLMGRALRRASRTFVLSSAQVAPLQTRFGLRPDSTVPIDFGINTDFFSPPPDTRVDRDLVVSTGNDRDRDFTQVLQAFERIREQRSTTRLTIVSESVEASRVAGAQGVQLIPRLPHTQLRQLVARAAVNLILTRPNLHVSGVTAALESASLGRPVVISGTAGMLAYAPPDGGIAVVTPGDVEAAARLCLELLSDPEDADGRGARGRSVVIARFSTRTQAEQLAELTRTVIAVG